MKKKVVVLVIGLIQMFMVFAQINGYENAVGDGSSSETPILIRNANDLIYLSLTIADWSKDFKQVANIDFADDETLVDWDNDGVADGITTEGFATIGTAAEQFRGSYNGDGHTISNLFIKRPTDVNIGLFGYLVASEKEIKNLGLLNVEIYGANFTGALVGTHFSGKIYQCFSTGSVVGTQYTGNYIGGLIGYVYTASAIVSNSYSHASVEGNSWIGGFAGVNKGTISNSYSTGTVTGASAAGFCAYNYTSIDDCFWDTETSGLTSGSNGTGILTSAMKDQSTFTSVAWDFLGESVNGDDDVWAIDSELNNGYPYIVGLFPDAATPITLSTFLAEFNNGRVELSWETASETNNAAFLIYRNGEAIAKIDGAGTSSELNKYTYLDKNVISGVTYNYILSDVDYANKEIKYDDFAQFVHVPEAIVNQEFEILSAYPNPFNPSVTLAYQLSSAEHINAKIYNSQGRMVHQLVDADSKAGSYELMWDASNMPSGVYILCVEAGNNIKTQKLVLMK